MKKTTIKSILGASIALALSLSSCSKFDEINTDPVAASGDQVQVEYFINNSIVGAQMEPHMSERMFILYWKTASRQHMSGGLSSGSDNDDWSRDYWSSSWMAGWQNSINSAIQVGEEQIAKGTGKEYTPNLIQVARIWRAYLISELSDGYGPVATQAYTGVNPDFASVKDAYYFILAELKDASAKMDINVISPDILNKEKVSFEYKYDWAKWQKFANSLRMRYAMRLSEVDPDKAKTEFEDAVKGSIILDAADNFRTKEYSGWDNLVSVMERPWYPQIISATMNNLFQNLGGIPSADQGLPADIQAAIKPASYIGEHYPEYYATKTNDPTIGYWLDGIPNKIDPRAYKAFIIPGWFDNPDMATNIGDWDKTERDLLDTKGEKVKTINAKYTWNTTTTGDWGVAGVRNKLRNYSGTGPMLAMKFRNSTNYRLFFTSWETNFLIAEAAERGWAVPISGKAAYEAGIKANFEYWGVDAHLSNYLTSTAYNYVGTSVSWDHITEPGNSHTMDYKDGMTGVAGTVDIKYPVNNLYKDGTVRNDRMTKIITQKYIGHLPYQPLEAWNDKRRTGLPFFENPAIENPLPALPGLNSSNYMTSKVEFFPQRIRYPSSLKSGSPKGYAQAIDLLGGPESDKVLTPLWWAKKK